VHRDGIAGVDGLDGASGIAVSPDDAHVYVASETEHALAVFQRNVGSGTLAFVEVHRDGLGGVNGLAGARAVDVSADGAHVYAGGATDGVVAIFARDAVSGALAFVATTTVRPALSGIRTIAVSADGARVLVASEPDRSIALFDRDAATGRLSYRMPVSFGSPSTVRLALAPNGIHVYATGLRAYAVTPVCDPAPRDCPPGPKARLLISDSDVDKADRFQFQSMRGPASVMGFPDRFDSYATCIYDMPGGTPRLVLAALAPAGGTCGTRPCWKLTFGSSLPPISVGYTDSTASPDGMTSIKVKHWVQINTPDLETVGVNGRRENLPVLVAPPLVPPVTAQLVNTISGCWSGTFTGAQIKKNVVLPTGRRLFQAVP
jgi:hypothetical protein